MNNAENLTSTAKNLSENKVFVYGAGAVLIGVGLYVINAEIRAWINGVFNGIGDIIHAVIPKPSSQNINQRTASDKVTGIFYANSGDRALSDLLSGYSVGGVMPTDVKDRQAILIREGYMNADGSFTEKGQAFFNVSHS